MEFNKRKTSCIFFNVLYSEIGCKDGKKGKFHSLCALPTVSMCVMDWGFWILKLAVRLDVSRVWLLLSWPDEGLAVQALPAPSFMAGGALAFGIFRSSLRGRVGFWLSVFPALSFMAGWGVGFRCFRSFLQCRVRVSPLGRFSSAPPVRQCGGRPRPRGRCRALRSCALEREGAAHAPAGHRRPAEPPARGSSWPSGARSR